ncbi:MAG: cupredoxin domain-containing protein [Corynebacterium sp.]|uniref:cupredoxin domain-containing protein n=1 Tax=Corynebacterium sp. TaxID=1720 RepID=UPI0026DB06DB|nr:cupredoxin domain-containing protein [Corynebacterium sp.]MDO4761927.1 cupredoxin domain-containing protein [Corynebacterium sp.]
MTTTDSANATEDNNTNTPPAAPSTTTPAAASTRTQRAPRHHRNRRALLPITAWMIALVLVSLVHWAIPGHRWLLIHMFSLGVLTNSVLVWTHYFTEKFLHHRHDDTTRRWHKRRIIALNIAISATLIGQLLTPSWAPGWTITAAGSIGIGLVLIAHTYSLSSHYRAQHHEQRYASAVLAHIYSTLFLTLGVGMGAIAAQEMGDPLHSQLRLAHLNLSILGFIGLAALGTLTVLFPAIWRTRTPAPTNGGISILALGVVIAATGFLLGHRIVAVAGLLLYLAGLFDAALGWSRCINISVKDPRDRITFAAASTLCAPLWLIGALITLIHSTLTADTTATITLPTTSVLVGFAAQLLIGVMSYLLPTTLGGGSKAVRTGQTVFNRAGLFRSTLINIGLIIWLATDNSWLRVVSSLLVFGSLAIFLILSPLAVRAQRGVVRRTRQPLTLPATPRWGQITAALAVLAFIIASFGGLRTPMSSGPPAPATNGTAHTAARTEIAVTMGDMEFQPSELAVPKGNELILHLHNTDTQAHDLKFTNGARSGRIEPGETSTLYVGGITDTTEGWCTIAGHKAQGMTLTVNPTAPPTASDAPTNPQSQVAHPDTVPVDNGINPTLQPINRR